MSYMSHQPPRRRPLGEATQRVNNSQLQPPAYLSDNLPVKNNEDLNSNCNIHSKNHNLSEKQGNFFVKPRLSTVLVQNYENMTEYRDSNTTVFSSNSRDRLKSHIGPWKLGKTLGRGSSARVRLARHQYTGQEAAVKIVRKSSAHISQSGSLANFEREESRIRGDDSGLRRMPAGIEREVAIMKLIQHPNILKLYDIWENRKEIYLCLEYVDNGELFEQIAENGGLKEEEAIGYFRQILSAVGYCHSFNICHRDLKPENILLTSNGQIKIADFGMAALHQAPGHQLSTSCGSPHYAAPELVKGTKYRGDMVDIWSLGVILYASLSGRLPFDVESVSKEWLAQLLTKIKRGQYEMPVNFSPEAKSLIWKMLQVNPSDRITLSQIWKHPLLIKYSYLDKLGLDSYSLPLSAQTYCYLRLQRQEVNSEIFRHLRSMWHTLSEKQLMEALLKDEPNDQKLFYVLLVKFRDAQLENYIPDLEYSASDYHHVKPTKLTKTYSTCQFPQSGKGQIRTVSRFTVISNASKSGRAYILKRNNSEKENQSAENKICRNEKNSKLNITRNVNFSTKIPEKLSNTISHVQQKTQIPRRPKRVFVSRSSLASSSRSRKRARRARVLREKRERSLTYPHKFSGGDLRSISADSPLIQGYRQQTSHAKASYDHTSIPYPVKRPPGSESQSPCIKCLSTSSDKLLRVNPLDDHNFSEDIQQQSFDLAKDCDKAFNFSEDTNIQNLSIYMSSPEFSTPNRNFTISDMDERRLPKPKPMEIGPVKLELLQARKQEVRRELSGDESFAYLGRIISNIDQQIEPSSPNNSILTRGVASVPVNKGDVNLFRKLPSVYENRYYKTHSRKKSHTSIAPSELDRLEQAIINSGSSFKSTDWMTRSNTPDETQTVRLSSPYSPMDIPSPLLTRKMSQQSDQSSSFDVERIGDSSKRVYLNEGFREHHLTGEFTSKQKDHGRFQERIANDDPFSSSNAFNVKKKINLFKKDTASGGEIRLLEKESQPLKICCNDAGSSNEKYLCFPQELKKRASFNFARLFKKKNLKPDMVVCNNDDYEQLDTVSDTQDLVLDTKSSPDNERLIKENDRYRQVPPQRNWFARLFKVRPEVRFICFSVQKKKARRETVRLLRDWRRFGIEDMQVDKMRNVVFGKVGSENYFNLKNVSFTAEFMTVVEHGKRSALSISRWTQGHGAASSLHKVVENLEKNLKKRDLLVTEEKKKKMMIKTIKLLQETYV